MREHPDVPELWSQLVLALDLTNRHQEAVEAQQNAAKSCADKWTVVHDGDCDRDHVLYSIRHRLVPSAFQYLARARRKHKDDPNRLIVLDMVEARIWLSVHDYQKALWCFALAIRQWEEMEARATAGKSDVWPNAQWRFNCQRWALVALVARLGRKQPVVQELWQSLQQAMPRVGSPDVHASLKLVMKYGWLGVQVVLFMETPRGQRLFGYLQNLPATRHVIERAMTNR